MLKNGYIYREKVMALAKIVEKFNKKSTRTLDSSSHQTWIYISIIRDGIGKEVINTGKLPVNTNYRVTPPPPPPS